MDVGRDAQEAKLQESNHKLQDAKAYITNLEANAGLALDHIEALQQEIKDDSAVTTIKQESKCNAELVARDAAGGCIGCRRTKYACQWGGPYQFAEQDCKP